MPNFFIATELALAARQDLLAAAAAARLLRPIPPSSPPAHRRAAHLVGRALMRWGFRLATYGAPAPRRQLA